MATASTDRQAEPQRRQRLLVLLLTALMMLSLVLRLRPAPVQPGDPLLVLRGERGHNRPC